MHRMTGFSICWVLLLGAVLLGCASLPAPRPATDVAAIAGKWEGTVTAANGNRFAFTTTISGDGTTESVIPALSNPGPRFTGRVTVQDGKYRWKSNTTGRTGTYTLHEGEGRRVLVSRADDGSSYAEATPAK